MQPLMDQLDARDIPYLDLTRSFHVAFDGGPICPVLSDVENCDGHFNAEGNRMISEFLYEFITENHYL